MPYIDHRDAQNVARLMRREAPLPPRRRTDWDFVVGVLMWIALLGYIAWAVGTQHGHTQRDIAVQYSKTK